MDLLDTATEASPVREEMNSAVSSSVHPRKSWASQFPKFPARDSADSDFEDRPNLKYTAHGDIARTNDTEPSGKIWNGAAGRQLFAQDMDRNRQFATLAMLIRIAKQLDEAEREEQACQKIKGTILVAIDKKVGASLLTGQLQVDFVPCGDFLDQICLENLQPGT